MVALLVGRLRLPSSSSNKSQALMLLTLNLLPYAFISLATALLLLLAIWAGLSRRHWFLRAAVACAALAALFPIRAFEPMVWFAVAMPLTAWLSCVARRRCQVTPSIGNDERQGDRNSLQFRLADFFLVILLAGVISALGAGLWRERIAIDWRIGAMVLCCVVVAELCLIVTLTRSLPRVLAAIGLLVAIGCCSALYAWVLHDSIIGEAFSYLPDFRKQLYGAAFFLGCFAVVVLVALLLARLMASSRVAASDLRRRAAMLPRVAFVFAALGVLVPMLMVYVRMLEGPRTPENPYADPNSYSKISVAINEAVRLNPGELSIGDLQRATSADNAKQLEQLYAELLLVLETPGFVPFDFEQDTRHDYVQDLMVEARHTRSMSRMLQAESESAAAAGRPDEASKYSLATMQMGNTVSRGGLFIHSLVGIAVEGVGSHGIVKTRGEVSIAQAKSLLTALQRLDQSRESFALTADREAAFGDQTYNWVPRLEIAVAWLQGRVYESPSSATSQGAVTRRNATLRLLIADLAIRLYQDEHGRLPDSLEQLVPEFLAAVPIDTFSGKPIIYRKTDEGWLIYSAGGDGKDDGGRFGTYVEALFQSGFDFDLEITIR
jgi:hypothetical protein